MGSWWGDYLALYFASTGSGKERPLGDCEGQTGLISLQRPLKFLPCDTNEVIHRKAAARHASPPPPAPSNSPSCFFHKPLAASLIRAPFLVSLRRLYLRRVGGRGGRWMGGVALCRGKKFARAAESTTASRSMAPERGWGEQRGGMRSCARVAVPGEGDNSLALRLTSTEK